MMESRVLRNRVSLFMLERYRLDELGTEDKKTVEEAIARDAALRSLIKNMDDSDRELRLCYTYESLLSKGSKHKTSGRLFSGFRRRILFAAALILCVLLPVSVLWLNNNPIQDRAKGSEVRDIELALYLQGRHESPLPEKALLLEGDTVQLAYTTPAGEHYGIIFSVDGRQVVTMHHPIRRGQSSLLVSGRHTYLDAAYILDDAPGFEFFAMIISREPLNAETVFREAQRITGRALDSYNNPVEVMESLENEIRTAFRDFDVEILKMLKK